MTTHILHRAEVLRISPKDARGETTMLFRSRDDKSKVEAICVDEADLNFLVASLILIRDGHADEISTTRDEGGAA